LDILLRERKFPACVRLDGSKNVSGAKIANGCWPVVAWIKLDVPPMKTPMNKAKKIFLVSKPLFLHIRAKTAVRMVCGQSFSAIPMRALAETTTEMAHHPIFDKLFVKIT
jgi:hypothetical protein